MNVTQERSEVVLLLLVQGLEGYFFYQVLKNNVIEALWYNSSEHFFQHVYIKPAKHIMHMFLIMPFNID